MIPSFLISIFKERLGELQPEGSSRPPAEGGLSSLKAGDVIEGTIVGRDGELDILDYGHRNIRVKGHMNLPVGTGVRLRVTRASSPVEVSLESVFPQKAVARQDETERLMVRLQEGFSRLKGLVDSVQARNAGESGRILQPSPGDSASPSARILRAIGVPGEAGAEDLRALSLFQAGYGSKLLQLLGAERGAYGKGQGAHGYLDPLNQAVRAPADLQEAPGPGNISGKSESVPGMNPEGQIQARGLPVGNNVGERTPGPGFQQESKNGLSGSEKGPLKDGPVSPRPEASISSQGSSREEAGRSVLRPQPPLPDAKGAGEVESSQSARTPGGGRNGAAGYHVDHGASGNGARSDSKVSGADTLAFQGDRSRASTGTGTGPTGRAAISGKAESPPPWAGRTGDNMFPPASQAGSTEKNGSKETTGTGRFLAAAEDQAGMERVRPGIEEQGPKPATRNDGQPVPGKDAGHLAGKEKASSDNQEPSFTPGDRPPAAQARQAEQAVVREFSGHLELATQLHQHVLKETGLNLFIFPFLFADLEGAGQWSFWKEGEPESAEKESGAPAYHLAFDLYLKNLGQLNIHLLKEGDRLNLFLAAERDVLPAVRQGLSDIAARIKALGFQFESITCSPLEEGAGPSVSPRLLNSDQGTRFHLVT